VNTTKGILLAGGRGSRLAPITSVINKHLLPVYDKPMIYYPLSTIMMCGIREIAIVTNPEDIYIFKKLLGDGSDLGLELEYFVQEKPNGLPEAFTITEEFIDGCRSVLMLGDNLLIGQGLGTTLETHLNKPVFNSVITWRTRNHRLASLLFIGGSAFCYNHQTRYGMDGRWYNRITLFG